MIIGPDKPPTAQDIVDAHHRRRASSFEVLLAACDGEWTTETPSDIAEIALNTINRKNDEIVQLKSCFTSELDETLLKDNLLKTYGDKTTGFRVSCEHYRYLAQQIISLRNQLRGKKFNPELHSASLICDCKKRNMFPCDICQRAWHQAWDLAEGNMER